MNSVITEEEAAQPSDTATSTTVNETVLPTSKLEIEKPMTDSEKKRRDEKVAQIVKAGSDLLLASRALEEIRDNRLYRDSHKNFDDFCKDVFEITAARASQLISAARQFVALKDKVDEKLIPTTEAALRQLRTVDEDYKVDVLELAAQLSDQNRPTGATIQQAWQQLRELKGETTTAKKTKKVKPGRVLKQTETAIALLQGADKATFTLGELTALKKAMEAFANAAKTIASE